jgi:phage shock protein C
MKHLYRSREGRKIFGVLGGISAYWNWEPALVRVIYVLIALFTGFFPAIIAYAVAWLVIDEEPANR